MACEYVLDVERVEYGYVRVLADSKEEAIRKAEIIAQECGDHVYYHETYITGAVPVRDAYRQR